MAQKNKIYQALVTQIDGFGLSMGFVEKKVNYRILPTLCFKGNVRVIVL